MKHFLEIHHLHIVLRQYHHALQLDVSSDFELDTPFLIHQNLAIVKYIFNAKIDIKNPFKELTILKIMSNNTQFSHTISYHIRLIDGVLDLEYDLSGNFGSAILEISLKPILHGVIIDELRNIKVAVESSDDIIESHNRAEKLKPT